MKTSIDKNYEEEPLTDEDVENKIVVSVQSFDGKQTIDEGTETGGIPMWAYIAGGAALVAVIGLIIWLVRRRKIEMTNTRKNGMKRLRSRFGLLM